MGSTDRLEVFVIPGFHWDRAWYEGFQKFRIRLVDAMDRLIEILARRPEYRFTLDGQTAVLEDYLEIRPEQREALGQFIAEKRLAVGPWYVLPDERIPCGESHIRNLLAGHRIAKEFGGVMKAGHTPDAFGHISQLPQILNGFGIGTSLFSRGIPEGTLPSEFTWESPDGSSVKAYNTWYLNAWRLGTSDEYGADYLESLVNELAERSSTGIICLMTGMDHLEPQEGVLNVVEKAKQRGMDIRIATLDEMLDCVAEKALENTYSGECPLPGENLRNPHLPGVLSTRTYLKQANSEAEKGLLLAEQLCTFAAGLGQEFPAMLLRRGWKYLLLNHPHDDICGCSADVVHRDNTYRFEQALEIASGVVRRSLGDRNPRALEQLVSEIDTSGIAEDEFAFVVYNSLGADTTGIVGLALPEEMHDTEFHILGARGKRAPHAVKDDTLEVLARDVPSCGFATYRVVGGKRRQKRRVKVDGRTMENAHLNVTIEGDGSVTILDKSTGETYVGCNVFSDDEDAGCTYNHSHCPNPRTYESTLFEPEIVLEESTGLSAAFSVRCVMKVPASLSEDLNTRSPELLDMEITSRVILEGDSPTVRFETSVENTAKDHRVSVRFPTGVGAETCFAEGHFDVIERPTELPDNAYPRFCVRNYVSVRGNARGAALIPDGLCEYEALAGDDGTVTLALTLLRGVGCLSRNSPQALAAGPEIETPEAQCLGLQKFEYAFMPHTEDDFESGLVSQVAYAHNHGLLAERVKNKSGGTLQQRHSFLTIPEGLILSAVKRGEEYNDRTYVRVWNPGSGQVDGTLAYFKDLNAAYLVGLDEQRKEELCCKANAVAISVRPKEILTVELVSE